MPRFLKRLLRIFTALGRSASQALALWTLASIIVAALLVWKDWHAPAWLLFIAVALIPIALSLGFGIGLTFGTSAEEAARLEADLQVAHNYLAQTEDFMESFRESIGLGPPGALERLPRLRDLLFDAVVQNVNTGRGEHVRCVFLVPVDEGGERMLAPKYHRGHTDAVRRLRLHADGRSVAGHAFTTREVVYVPDADADPRVQQTPATRPVKTLLCLPTFPFIPQSMEPIGVLSVASNRENAFDSLDQAFISLCGALIGLLEFATQLLQAADRVRRLTRIRPGG
jgi:hypothetical protein